MQLKLNMKLRDTWLQFPVPWEKLGSTTLSDLEEGVRSKQLMKEVVHIVASSLRSRKTNLPSKAIKVVANKIVSRYPKSFQDVDEDGYVYGDGSHTIFSKIMEHVKYLNQSDPKRKRPSLTADIPLQKRKKMLASKAGCSHWQPQEVVEETQAIEEYRKFLETADFKMLNSETTDILEKTYPAQRLFLNNPTEPPTIQEIKLKWPILLSPAGICYHYKKLMSQDITSLGSAMISKSTKIFTLGLQKKYITAIPSTKDDDVLLMMALEIICKFFTEDFSLLYRRIKVSFINSQFWVK